MRPNFEDAYTEKRSSSADSFYFTFETEQNNTYYLLAYEFFPTLSFRDCDKCRYYTVDLGIAKGEANQQFDRKTGLTIAKILYYLLEDCGLHLSFICDNYDERHKSRSLIFKRWDSIFNQDGLFHVEHFCLRVGEGEFCHFGLIRLFDDGQTKLYLSCMEKHFSLQYQ